MKNLLVKGHGGRGGTVQKVDGHPLNRMALALLLPNRYTHFKRTVG